MCKVRAGSNRLYVSFGSGFTVSIRVFQAFDAVVTSVVFGRDSFWAGYAKRDQGVGEIHTSHHAENNKCLNKRDGSIWDNGNEI